MVVAVADSQQPTRSATGTLTIRVQRNTNCPEFEGSYQVTIPETHPVGEPVIQVNATDKDGDTLSYRLVNLNAETSRLFMIDYRTGEIITKGTLMQAPTGQQFLSYVLTVEANDQQYPKECVKTTPVSITIRRDRILTRLTYSNKTILATVPVNTTVLEMVAIDDDLEGDLTFELIGSYPGTEFFGIEESGQQAGNQQTLRVYVKKPLTEDQLKSNLYLVSKALHLTQPISYH